MAIFFCRGMKIMVWPLFAWKHIQESDQAMPPARLFGHGGVTGGCDVSGLTCYVTGSPVCSAGVEPCLGRVGRAAWVLPGVSLSRCLAVLPPCVPALRTLQPSSGTGVATGDAASCPSSRGLLFLVSPWVRSVPLRSLWALLCPRLCRGWRGRAPLVLPAGQGTVLAEILPLVQSERKVNFLSLLGDRCCSELLTSTLAHFTILTSHSAAYCFPFNIVVIHETELL